MWEVYLKFCSDFLIKFQIMNQCFLSKSIYFDHNSAPSARIEPRFCTVAALGEMKNFCLDRFEGYPIKKLSFRDFGLYLARARARARARTALVERGASGPFDKEIREILHACALGFCAGPKICGFH